MLSTGSLCDQSGVACATAACQAGRRPFHSLGTGRSSLNGSSGYASSPKEETILLLCLGLTGKIPFKDIVKYALQLRGN